MDEALRRSRRNKRCRHDRRHDCRQTCPQVVVSTEQGELYLFENLEFRCFLQTSPADGNAICNLVAFSRGFVSGGANGMLRVYEKSEDPKEFYRCLKVGEDSKSCRVGPRSASFLWCIKGCINSSPCSRMPHIDRKSVV